METDNPEDYLGLQVLWSKPGQDITKIEHDIVLVHGLWSGPISDWQEENTPFWPIDFLGRDLDNTRILSFGYPTSKSTFIHDDVCEEGRVFNHGEALCNDLIDEETRQKALCYSYARESQFAAVLQKTKHVIFLDTPHVGINPDAWRSISKGTFSENSTGQWTLWSNVLSDIQKSFGEIAPSFNISSACASLSDRPQDNVTPGDSGLTYQRHERTLTLHGVKHFTISKFSSHQDSNYKTLLDRIKVGRTCRTKDPQKIKEIRNWIDPGATCHGDDDFNKITYEKALSQRHPETCQWLLKHKSFRNWRSLSQGSGSNRFVWLTGGGGEGKTVLCSSAIEHIHHFDKRAATPFLMITYGKDRTKHNMAAILAAQLLEHLVNDGIDTEVLSLLRRSSTMVENLHEMIRLLDKQCTTVYFFLDGLNEVKTAEEDPSEMRRVYLEFLSEGLHSTVYFLTSLTQDKSMDVRLWCSSQRSQPIVEWLERLGPTQISMNKSSVGLDVQSYLKSVQEGILDRLSEPHRTVAKKSLSAQAGTNFRWVFMMQASLDKITIPDLLLEKILQGLPERLETFYAERLQELRALDRQGSKDSNPNLSINILSLLAYSKRPLSVTEVQEALSIIEMPWDCGSLTKGRMIEREAIIHRCELFVDFIPFPSSPSDGYLKLSHGSVFKFLHGSPEGGQRQDKGQSDALDSSSRNDPVVKGSIIAKACLKYLSQDRYSVLLNKVSSTEFKTSAPPRQRVCDHKFLCYAAKHWFHHLQEVGHSLKRCANVAKFLLSPQFLVTLQVQSLFCPGHFIHPFHQYKGGRSTGNKIQVKRHLPSWFENCVERGNMVSDFDKFLAEWKNFLHLGETECLNGEIERCFWGALGPSSFMYKTGSMIERNKSVLLDAAPQIMGSARKNVSEGPWLYETISQDEIRVSTWQVCTRSDSSHPTLQLTRYKWCLDSHNPPTPYGEPETTPFPSSLNLATRYLARFPSPTVTTD
ncbi:hypothetical protein IWZ00DRAFT_316077 [Phyllosticta capitalensis]